MKTTTTFGEKQKCKCTDKSSFKSKLFISSFIGMKKKVDYRFYLLQFPVLGYLIDLANHAVL